MTLTKKGRTVNERQKEMEKPGGVDTGTVHGFWQ